MPLLKATLTGTFLLLTLAPAVACDFSMPRRSSQTQAAPVAAAPIAGALAAEAAQQTPAEVAVPAPATAAEALQPTLSQGAAQIAGQPTGRATR